METNVLSGSIKDHKEEYLKLSKKYKVRKRQIIKRNYIICGLAIVAVVELIYIMFC